MISTIFAFLKSKANRYLIAAVLALTVVRCLWLWQPGRQVELHQRHFLDAAQDRKWGKLNAMFADDFRTPTGHDKAWALRQSGEVLRQFIALEIRDSDTAVTMQGDTARVSTMLHIEGSGLQLAELAKSAVNQSTAPFEFTWKHKSWMPWDWRLVAVDHPLLHVGTEFD